jgi:hypothetical protein
MAGLVGPLLETVNRVTSVAVVAPGRTLTKSASHRRRAHASIAMVPRTLLRDCWWNSQGVKAEPSSTKRHSFHRSGTTIM